VSLLGAFRRVLVLAPHTDDEFGCAGTMLRLVEAGADVHYIALSRCEESLPAALPLNTLEVECRACLDALGVPATNLHILGFSVRHFPEHRQQILEGFVEFRKELEPDLVLLPSSFDTHQDHETVAREGFRAFKTCSIWGYELPQNLITFRNTAFVQLTPEQLDRKTAALRCYRSQAFRDYAADDFITGLAHLRGVQCGTRFAEAFEVVRLIA
jgi:LmbE family N-acetylglucosaminyl deacetylase